MSLIEKYFGKEVVVVTSGYTPIRIAGTLRGFDGTFLLLEAEKGITLIPLNSVLHISWLFK